MNRETINVFGSLISCFRGFYSRIFAILVDSAAVWNSNGIDHLVYCSKEIQWFGARLKVVEALFRKDSSSVSFSTED